jgi:hypothetical protein
MEKGEIRQEIRTTQPEQPGREFLEEAARAVADDVGLSFEQLSATSSLTITEEPMGSRFIRGESENWLRILWYRDTPAAIAVETRNERNNVVTQMAYFGPSGPQSD